MECKAPLGLLKYTQLCDKNQNQDVCFVGDEVLEVNGLKVKGKSVHDICDTLCQMTGTLTFVIVPGPGNARFNEFTQIPVIFL